MVPTKRFWWLAAAGVPVAAVSAQGGAAYLGVFYDLLLLGAACASWRLAPDARSLRVKRRFDPVLSARVDNKIELEVLNDSLEPIRGRFRDEPPRRCAASGNEFSLDVEPGATVTKQYAVVPAERGSGFFRGSFVRVGCPLGLVEREFRLQTEQPARVYPNVLALREFELLRQKGRLRQMGIRRTRIRGLGTEFESLREYIEGDDFRKLDWKASARRGKLVVRNFEQERNQCVLLCVDAGRRMLAEVDGVRKLDHVLDALLMLAQAAVHAGDLVGLLVFSDRVCRYIPPRKGRSSLGAIVEAVHDLVADPVESDPQAAFAYLASRWKRRSLLVCFTDVEEPDQARALARSLLPLSRRHLTLVSRVSDPLLAACAQRPLRDAEDLYVRAAAEQLVGERQLAASTLRAHNVHGLDAEPQDLAAALVSHYFDVKARGAL